MSKIWTGNENCDENQVQQNNLKQTTVGTMESYAGGVHVRPANMQAGIKKPETPQLAARYFTIIVDLMYHLMAKRLMELLGLH